MNNYTKEDIIRLVEEEDVEFIRLQFTDLFGNLKNIAVTASQLDRVLSNKCMFDGSAIDGFARIEESDMYLYPDLSTLEIFPWSCLLYTSPSPRDSTSSRMPSSA